jgi:glycosyltransferase involved in cell wall biosynthesis
VAASTSRRITLVSSELLGVFRNGGIGTATTFLALALGRAGHDVEVLLTGDPPAGELAASWALLYEQHGVRTRFLPASSERVEPTEMRIGRSVAQALRRDPPDVVIAQDWQGAAAQAITLRRLSAEFASTRFIAYCHGPSAWLADAAGKVRGGRDALERDLAERAVIASSDVAVFPSAFLLSWLREREWTVPDRSLVVPLLTRAAALGEDPPPAVPGPWPAHVRRIAFFGRLGPQKGIETFLEALSLVDPQGLKGVELAFVGNETKNWRATRIASAVADATGRADLIRIETGLDQPQALALLREPGTLAVMPSRLESALYTVYECLENGIPFIAGSRGGQTEVIAERDHARALVPPGARALAEALDQSLRDGIRPVAPAYDPTAARTAWLDLVAEPLRTPPAASEAEAVSVGAVVAAHEADDDADTCVAALASQGVRRESIVILDIGADRQAALNALDTDVVLLLDAADRPLPGMVDALTAALRATGAGAVTCGQLAKDGTAWLFAGACAGLGVVENRFGGVGLIRRPLATRAVAAGEANDDPDWPVYAALALDGVAVESLPETLVERMQPPGDLRRAPVAARTVAGLYERTLPSATRGLARLAASETDTVSEPVSQTSHPARRALRRLTRR